MSRIRSLRQAAIILIGFFVLIPVGLVLAGGLGWDKNPVPRVDLAAEGIINANRTGDNDVGGFDGYLRTVKDQKVHTNFFLNTNSCASCHFTHNGQNNNLLFQASAYNTCTSCHFDTAMNTYNVLTGENIEKKPAAGGRFYDAEFSVSGRAGVSFHLATGLKKIGAAPGADTTKSGWWDKGFTCGSCHAPHGSYSSRHLHMNPNGQAMRYEGIPLVLTDSQSQAYSPSRHQDKVPWLHYGPETGFAGTHGVVIKNADNHNVTGAFEIHYRSGTAKLTGNAGPGPYTVSFSQAVIVDIEVIPAGSGRDEQVNYRGGTVAFCTSCHTGYLGENADGKKTTYHRNFSHVLDEDLYAGYISTERLVPDSRLRLEKSRNTREQRLVCLTCHFAHGTDAALMVDRNFEPMYGGGNLPTEPTFLLRFGKSSDGRESCLVCHQQLVPEEEPPAENSPPAEDGGIPTLEAIVD